MHAAPAMASKRSACGVAVVEGSVYAIGGRDFSSRLSSVERFDGNSWTLQENMTTARSKFGVAEYRCLES